MNAPILPPVHSLQTLIALAKSAPKLFKGESLPPGEYPVADTVTVRLEGTVTKQADGEYTPTGEIPLLDSIAIFLSRMGPKTSANVLAIWEESVRAALAGEGAVDEGIRGEIEDTHERIRESLDALPKKTRAGAIICHCVATIVPPTPEEQTSVPPVQDKSRARRKPARKGK